MEITNGIGGVDDVEGRELGKYILEQKEKGATFADLSRELGMTRDKVTAIYHEQKFAKDAKILDKCDNWEELLDHYFWNATSRWRYKNLRNCNERKKQWENSDACKRIREEKQQWNKFQKALCELGGAHCATRIINCIHRSLGHYVTVEMLKDKSNIEKIEQVSQFGRRSKVILEEVLKRVG